MLTVADKTNLNTRIAEARDALTKIETDVNDPNNKLLFSGAVFYAFTLSQKAAEIGFLVGRETGEA